MHWTGHTSTQVIGQVIHQVRQASAMALSLCWVAWSALLPLFCSRADQQERDDRRGRVDLELELVVEEQRDLAGDEDRDHPLEPNRDQGETEREEGARHAMRAAHPAKRSNSPTRGATPLGRRTAARRCEVERGSLTPDASGPAGHDRIRPARLGPRRSLPPG